MAIINKKIVTENGDVFAGEGFGCDKDAVVELVFNTSMAGYGEIMSDPSYTDQGVVMTYPLIGNYGIAGEDYESSGASPGALIVREHCLCPSNFRFEKTVDEGLCERGMVGISGVDTRAITRMLRYRGNCRAIITDIDRPTKECIDIIKATPVPHDQVKRVSVKEKELYPVIDEPVFKVAVIDCGAKMNIVRSLNELGCSVTVLPWDASFEDVFAITPDGVLISNGPGDPIDADKTIETVRKLLGVMPMMGICLGNQILALAVGAKTYKLKYGHHGGNHPVKNLRTGKIDITSQNHNYAVDPESLAGTGFEVSHVNLLDNTVEGIYSERLQAFGVQYHPESAPGPHDSGYVFRQFLELMKG